MRFWHLGLIVLLIVIDQLSKWLAVLHLPFNEAVSIVPFFSLYLTHNTGVAFSMLTWLGPNGLTALTGIIVLVMFYLWWRTAREQWLASLGFALIIGGAIGNIIDRGRLGYVIDYFLVHTETWAFAVFNVADSFITIGAIAIIAQELLSMRKPSSKPIQNQDH